MSVIGVVTISSPGSGSIAATAVWIAGGAGGAGQGVADAEERGEAALQGLDDGPLGAGQRAAAQAPRRAAPAPRRRAAAGGVLVGRETGRGCTIRVMRRLVKGMSVMAERCRSTATIGGRFRAGVGAGAGEPQGRQPGEQPAGGRRRCAGSSSWTGRAGALPGSPGAPRSADPWRSSRARISATPRNPLLAQRRAPPPPPAVDAEAAGVGVELLPQHPPVEAGSAARQRQPPGRARCSTRPLRVVGRGGHQVDAVGEQRDHRRQSVRVVGAVAVHRADDLGARGADAGQDRRRHPAVACRAGGGCSRGRAPKSRPRRSQVPSRLPSSTKRKETA